MTKKKQPHELMRRPPNDIFMERSFPEPNTGCWIWAGRLGRNGYGLISNHGRHTSAHRFSYALFNGDFDRSLHVLHKCDVPCCVNPDHLFLGTHQQNMHDRNAKGRCAKLSGEENGNSKLNKDQVLEIRRLHDPVTNPTRKLARIFGVSQRLIFNIIHRKTWDHV